MKEHCADDAAYHEVSIFWEVYLIFGLSFDVTEEGKNDRELHHQDQDDVGSAISSGVFPLSLFPFFLILCILLCFFYLFRGQICLYFLWFGLESQLSLNTTGCRIVREIRSFNLARCC